ncbi:hypothetical protein K470DRAFT_97100 [Piedraia hortae CBS 480.64]|uniref:Uncharacterized protein n=1 Tax=Piedraia hortae CBS 480.64 TaxID=1314780 RepID=A0A6A7BXM3_9PEZI|nr:hypothetical protein K470DRAFT_97100 [Piedraia hortae CBS 480.64]
MASRGTVRKVRVRSSRALWWLEILPWSPPRVKKVMPVSQPKSQRTRLLPYLNRPTTPFMSWLTIVPLTQCPPKRNAEKPLPLRTIRMSPTSSNRQMSSPLSIRRSIHSRKNPVRVRKQSVSKMTRLRLISVWRIRLRSSRPFRLLVDFPWKPPRRKGVMLTPMLERPKATTFSTRSPPTVLFIPRTRVVTLALPPPAKRVSSPKQLLRRRKGRRTAKADSERRRLRSDTHAFCIRRQRRWDDCCKRRHMIAYRQRPHQQREHEADRGSSTRTRCPTTKPTATSTPHQP